MGGNSHRSIFIFLFLFKSLSFLSFKVNDLLDEQVQQVIFLVMGQVIVHVIEDLEVVPDHVCAENLVFKVIGLKLDSLDFFPHLLCLNLQPVTDVSGEIIDHGPDLWAHGHTHNSFDYTIGKTRVVVNPYGYKDVEVNPQYDRSLRCRFLPNSLIHGIGRMCHIKSELRHMKWHNNN
ncbi:MAG: hypothetical protein CXR30_10315 [Geobacter sp.]|nr:MAG: hypothetical protein CXR30_10315 [Geobacter sp.]